MPESAIDRGITISAKRREKMESALRALGDTEHKVAARLRRQGFRGDRGSACACPVAKFLAQVTDVPVRVQAGQARTRDMFQTYVQLTPPVRQFVDSFDGGHWPSLEGDR